MTDWEEFIRCHRGVLIAPAEHGKTTAIADCLLQCSEGSRQLVLTHTHAGIASLRTKFMKKEVPLNRYHLETITGFAQRYVLSFLGNSVLPSEDDESYFNIAVEKCKELMRSSVVQNILTLSYGGVFVDEYQDCTIDQHQMVLELAHNLPLHLLGDPLQGIFSFDTKQIVDFDRDLRSFQHFNFLKSPWRWENTNKVLGKVILGIRKDLQKNNAVELQDNSDSGFIVEHCVAADDKYKKLSNILKNNDCDNVLIIYPSYKELGEKGKFILKGGLTDRIRIKQRVDFNNQFSILDAIDSKEYYACAKIIDTYISNCKHGKKIQKVARFYDIIKKLHFKMSVVQKWIDKDKNKLKNRTKDNARLSSELKTLFQTFESHPTLADMQNIIDFIRRLPNVKCYHKILYYTIKRCFDMALLNEVSMYDAMKNLKTRLRHQGRRVQGKYIGTTLLTKGLEFDTVILWDAHKFEDSKNFYVAISRACKRLVIMTETTNLNFNR